MSSGSKPTDADSKPFTYRLPRWAVKFEFRLQINERDIPCTCTDISPDGLGADISAEIEVGTRVRIFLPTKLAQPFIEVPAMIVHRNGFHCGLSLDLDGSPDICKLLGNHKHTPLELRTLIRPS